MDNKPQKRSFMGGLRKGQISIFMILGIFILLLAILVFYRGGIETEKGLPEVFSEIYLNIPSEVEPVHAFVNDCLERTATEALELIGEHGGYISLTDPDYKATTFKVTNEPTESDALKFSAESNLAIPYWWYLKSSNTCTGMCELSSKRPELTGGKHSIEGQVSTYVEKNILNCIDTFAPYEEQGFTVTPQDEPKAHTKITEDDVIVALEYPLEVSRGATTFNFDRFLTHLPVKLQTLYNLATSITNIQMQHRFLEKFALELLVAFSGVDSDKLPPMSDLRFQLGSTVTWSERDTKEKVQDLLTGYSQLFQVSNTRNFFRETFSNPLKQRLYDSYLILDTEPEANQEVIETFFSYLDFWPYYFNMNCNGDLCKPSSANTVISVLGVQEYRFVYDLSFPVMIELNDAEAFDGRGYQFRFALESNIRNNQPMKAEFRPLEQSSIGESSLLCHPDTFTSPEVLVKVHNTLRKPVQDAQVVYTVAGESCFLGVTNEDGELATPFPTGVIGGVVNAIATDHVGKATEFTPGDKLEIVNVDMSPVIEKKVKVMKKPVVNDGKWTFQNVPMELQPNEYAIVSLTRETAPGEEEFSTFAEYPSEDGEAPTMFIAPGEYQADITLQLQERVVIPSERRCQTIGGFFGDKQCVDFPEIDFAGESAEPLYLAGGLTTGITIPTIGFDEAETIVFYVVAPDLPTKIEDLDHTQDFERYSKAYRFALQPTFE